MCVGGGERGGDNTVLTPSFSFNVLYRQTQAVFLVSCTCAAAIDAIAKELYHLMRKHVFGVMIRNGELI